MCFKLHFETRFIAQCIHRTGRPQAEFRCAGSEAQILDPVAIAASDQQAFDGAGTVDGYLVIDNSDERFEILCQNFE